MEGTRPRQATDAATRPVASPVFVDATGRRRRRIRRAAFGLGIAAGSYCAVVVVSLLGGPVPPNVLLPLPGVHNGPASAKTATSATPNAAGTRTANRNAAAGPTSGAAAAAPGSVPAASPTAATAPTTAAASAVASPSASASRVPPGLAGKSPSPGATHRR